MNLNIYYRNYFKAGASSFLVLTAGLMLAVAFFAQIAAASEVPPELIPLAQKLGCDSQESCETAFNADVNRGVNFALDGGYYNNDPEVKKLAQTFKTEVLSQLTNAANFEEEIIKIAERIIKNKTLANQLNLNQQDVTAARVINTQLRGEGVDLNTCRKSADSLTREQLIACLGASNKLAENKDVVKGYISEERLNVAENSNDMIKLQEALNRGEYSQLGTKNTDELGNICLRPGSPSQCDEIAAKFFGQDGVKYLDQARQHVSSVTEKYLRQADSFTLTTPDGRNITGENAIGTACENAFNSRDIATAKACGDFAVKNGFSSDEEVQQGLDFIQSVQGTNVDFGQCRRNPKACEQFIPQDQREQFNVMQQIHDIMTAEIGFPPEQCEQGGTNPTIGKSCFEGSQRALPKLEVLAQNSPQVRQIINQIRNHITSNEKVINKNQEFQQTFKSQEGGPGGCKSSQECSAYCSNSANGPECISFGAKHQVFTGQEAVGRFQEYNEYIDNAPSFSGKGPFPGFQPSGQDGFPPGQYPGFTQPGPGFNPPPGTGGFPPNFGGAQGGPSPECFSAIQSGDFVRAKELCVVSGVTNLPPPQIIPSNCPSGQYWNGDSCVTNTYNTDPARGCTQAGGVWDSAKNYCNMPGNNPLPPNGCPFGQYWNGSACVSSTFTDCPSGQYWDGSRCVTSTTTCSLGEYWNGTSCVKNTYDTDPSKGCAQAGGIWNEVTKFCNMPGTTNCSSGQYWDGNKCAAYSNDPSIGCKEAGGTWDTVKNYCNMLGTANCSSGQYWDGSACVNNTQPSGQIQQTWNSFGLTSSIRADADPARIESLKQACANVKSGASIWMPGAGDYASPDFGMPSASKCQTAGNCKTEEYFDGTNCISSTSTSCDSSAARVSESACLAISGCKWSNNDCMYSAYTTVTCSSGQWWDSATQTCKTYTTGGTGCGSSAAQASQSECLATSSQCRWDNNACSYSTSTATTCPAGQYWNGTSCMTSNTAACSSGQYWNGSACVNTSTTDCTSGQYWNGTACVSSTNTTACSSGQYWNGSACVNTSTTDCTSGQYWDGSACVANPSTSSTNCGSGQYWDGSACVTNPSTSSTNCGSGQYWDGSACVSSTNSTTSEQSAIFDISAQPINPQSTLDVISIILRQIMTLLQSFSP